MRSVPLPIKIVAEEEEWLVINKPPFLEAHPTKPDGRITLWGVLRELLAFEIVNGGQVSVINRLDRETSGLTLIAKTRSAARLFHGLMERRAVEKEYLALVWNWPEDDEFTVDAPLLRQGAREPSRIYLKQMVHSSGAPARTRFVVEQRFRRESSNGERFSLIRAFPETGRMHQIRVHLSHRGHSIVGDKLYGPNEQCYLDFVRTGWTDALASRLLLSRQALHASALRVPSLGLAWNSPLPEDLSDWIQAGCFEVRASSFQKAGL